MKDFFPQPLNFGYKVEFQRSPRQMRRGLSSFIHKGRKVTLPVRVHSWLHSYPHTKPARGQAIFLEINGKGRCWTTKNKMIRDLGKDGFVLYYRDDNDTYMPVGEAYE